MARAIWSGSINFGLVNVPVKLFPAVRQKEVHFNMLHEEDGGRIKQKRVCVKDGEEVPWEEIAKGYEISPGKYVMITPKELEAFDPEATRSIDIEDFVVLDEIDPVFWEHNYYLAPDKGAQKAYALLFQAMKKANKVGIARVVLRTRQYLCAIRPMAKGLAMSTMNYADEIADITDLEGLPAAGQKPKERELEMAEKLIDSLTTAFEPKKYKDEYREKILGLIERKAEGEEIVTGPAPKEKGGKVVDLMAALEASLKKKPAAPAKEVKGERRHVAHAARTRRRKKR